MGKDSISGKSQLPSLDLLNRQEPSVATENVEVKKKRIAEVFHAYKKERNSICTNYNKIWNKIVWPFLICEIIICMVFIIRLHHTESSAIISDIVDWIKSGGYGPGAYYPWVYIQFAILLPLISPIFKISEPFFKVSFHLESLSFLLIVKFK